MNKEITREEYVLTNINKDCYYVVRLKDDKEYIIYKEGKRDYIVKDGEKIYLNDDVRQAVLSSIREYERYRNMKDKFFTKISKYIKKQDFIKLQKFIVKKSNKNDKNKNKKKILDEVIRKNTINCSNIEKIEIIDKSILDKLDIEEIKEIYLLLQDVYLKADDLLIKYQKQLARYEKVIDKKYQLLIELGNYNFKKNRIIDLMAEQLAGLTIFDNDIENALILGDKEEVKKYYEGKILENEE